MFPWTSRQPLVHGAGGPLEEHAERGLLAATRERPEVPIRVFRISSVVAA
jgi:hypothetical protein